MVMEAGGEDWVLEHESTGKQGIRKRKQLLTKQVYEGHFRLMDKLAERK